MNDSEKESTQNADSKEQKKGSTFSKRRYWSSWEEMMLVEFWRRYSCDVTTTLKHLPVYTSISGEMRTVGFQVNSQECRRKINGLKNKYIAERRILETLGKGADSDWKLYPLVHCLLSPLSPVVDSYNERNTVRQYLAKLPPILAVQKPPTPIDVGSEAKNMRQENGVSSQSLAVAAAVPASNPYKRPYRNPSMSYRNGFNFRLRHRFKFQSLEELQQDNHRLAEQRDYALKRLCVEEREVEMLEQIVQNMQCAGGK